MRKGNQTKPEISPSVAITVAVLSLIISIAFWMNLVSIKYTTTRESANHVVTTIQAWKESRHGKGNDRDLLITCDDGNMYEIRHILYERVDKEINSILAIGAEANIYTTFLTESIIEISINGYTVISFEAGYEMLLRENIAYACIAAFLDTGGIVLLVYGIVHIKKKRDSYAT